MAKKAAKKTEEGGYKSGGFEPRFMITRTDGKPIRPGARYIVLAGDGEDPHALAVLKDYAKRVRAENPQFADDLERMLGGDWPASHAQHADAK